MASSRLSQTTRATDRADHLHGEPSMAPRSERCAVSLSAPRPLTTLGASRSTGPFDEVRRVYGDFATALVLDHAADDIANQCVAPAFAVTSGVGRCRLVAGVQRLTFAGVEQPVVIVYASFASTAEPQVLGVASSAQRAE